jgi:ribosome-binding factor A
MRRVDEAVRAVLSDAIAKHLQDPRVGFVTVTEVKTSPDLRHARVYVSVLGDERARHASLEGLRSAHGFLQSRVATELTLKHTPTLTFVYDDTVDRAVRITELLRDPERQAGPGTGSGEPA